MYAISLYYYYNTSIHLKLNQNNSLEVSKTSKDAAKKEKKNLVWCILSLFFQVAEAYVREQKHNKKENKRLWNKKEGQMSGGKKREESQIWKP